MNDLDWYAIPSRLSESILLGTPLLRREPCACGGVIEAADADPAILAAVQSHNATAEHRAWRSEPRRDPTAIAPRDLSAVELVRPVPAREGVA